MMFDRYSENKTYPIHYSDENREIIENNPFNVLDKKAGNMKYTNIQEDFILKKDISRHIDFVVPCLRHLAIQLERAKDNKLMVKIAKLVLRKKLIRRKQEGIKKLTNILQKEKSKIVRTQIKKQIAKQKKVKIKIIPKTVAELMEFRKRQEIKNDIQHKLNLQRQSDMERTYLREIADSKKAKMLRNQKVRFRNAISRNGI